MLQGRWQLNDKDEPASINSCAFGSAFAATSCDRKASQHQLMLEPSQWNAELVLEHALT
jgi:hypothetical protein